MHQFIFVTFKIYFINYFNTEHVNKFTNYSAFINGNQILLQKCKLKGNKNYVKINVYKNCMPFVKEYVFMKSCYYFMPTVGINLNLIQVNLSKCSGSVER